MALKATVFKVELQIADMDRHYYQSHQLTLARHPSETDLRMMARILVFAVNADPQLQFTRGISTDAEPDLWQKSLTGDIEHWIELGEPDLKRIGRACGLARAVSVYAYGDRSAGVWWQAISAGLARFDRLRVFFLPEAQLRELAEMARRTMKLQVTIQEGEVWVADQERSVTINPVRWLPR